MKEELNKLISLGKQVFENELQINITPGLGHMNTVSGLLCDKWKGECLSLLMLYQNGGPIYDEAIKLASKNVLREKDGRRLLDILKDLEMRT